MILHQNFNAFSLQIRDKGNLPSSPRANFARGVPRRFFSKSFYFSDLAQTCRDNRANKLSPCFRRHKPCTTTTLRLIQHQRLSRDLTWHLNLCPNLTGSPTMTFLTSISCIGISKQLLFYNLSSKCPSS